MPALMRTCQFAALPSLKGWALVNTVMQPAGTTNRMDKALMFGAAFGLAALLSGFAAPVQAADLDVGAPSYSEDCRTAFTDVQDRFEAGEFKTLVQAGDALATVPTDCH